MNVSTTTTTHVIMTTNQKNIDSKNKSDVLLLTTIKETQNVKLKIPLCVQYGGNIVFRTPFPKRWLVIRLFLLFLMIACFSLTIISYSLCAGHCSFVSFFHYYTNHTLVLSFIYFLLSAFITCQVYTDISNDTFTDYSNSGGYPTKIKKKLKKFEIIRSIKIQERYNVFVIACLNLCYKCCLTSELFLTIAYWLTEFDAQAFAQNSLLDQTITFVTHGVVCSLLLIDFGMNGFRLKYSDIVYPLVQAIFTILWTFVFDYLQYKNMSGNEYLYASFNWDTDLSVAIRSSILFVSGIVFLHCVLTAMKKEALIYWNKTLQ